MKQADFDKILTALLEKKKYPMPEPKFDIEEIQRVAEQKLKEKKFSIKDFLDK